MPEPVNPAADWPATRGCAGPVTVQAYNPATDDFAAAVTTSGTRTGRQVAYVSAGDGEVRVIRASVTFLGTPFASRPPLNSLMNIGAEVWVIAGYRSDPRDTIHTADVVLS